MNTQTKVLKAITDTFNEEYIPAIFREKVDDGEAMNIVSLLYTEYGNGDGEAGVDLFFLPISAAQSDIQYFSVVINIAEEIDASYKAGLIETLNTLNFLTPFGTYACTPEGTVVFYKLVTPLPADLSEEELLKQVNILTANALDTAEGFVGLLQKFVKGDATAADIQSLI